MPSFPKSIQSISESRTINAGVTTYFAWGTGRLREDATETNRQVPIRTPGRISGFLVNLPQNTCDGATVVTIRKNAGATIMTITIPAGETGTFPMRNADAYIDVVDGDLLCYECAVGGTTGSISWGQISTLFEVTTSATGAKTCVTRLVCNGVSGSVSTASTTRYTEIAGDNDLSGTAEADKNIRIYNDGKLSHLAVYVSANTRNTDTTITLKINTPGTGTLTVTIPGGQTGWFEDTTHTDTISSGDNLNYQLTTGANAGTITIQVIAMTYTSENGVFPAITSFTSGVNVNFNTTTYASFGGLSFNSTSAFRLVRNRVRLKVTGLYAYVFSNTIATNDTVLSLYSGGKASALSIAIVAGGTGIGSDTVNEVFQTAQDGIIFQVVTPNTSGTINFRSIAVVCQFLETPTKKGIGLNFGITNAKRLILGRRVSTENLAYPM
jgi:hypothetical protein